MHKRNNNTSLPKPDLKSNQQKIKERIKIIMKFNDDEINELDYKLALLYDKR